MYVWYNRDITTATIPIGAGEVLAELAIALPELSPQLATAGRYILDNPAEVAVISMRTMAEAAEVTPNTLVRLARAIGFDGYEQFRQPFRRQAAEGVPSFPDRARFLQSINTGGTHGRLTADMAASALSNVESLFAGFETAEVKSAADLIVEADQTCILGVGIARPMADNFAYVAKMARLNVRAIPTTELAVDDIASMGPGDVLVAMTFAPYRTETIEAVRMARKRDISVIAISDSLAAPIAWDAAHAFSVPTDSPLPFSSTVATVALLETLLAFVLADSQADVADAIESFHQHRRQAGVYID